MRKWSRMVDRIVWYLSTLGFIGFISRMLYQVYIGKGTEHYISVKGFQLSPIGILVLLVLIPVCMFFASRVGSKEREIEEDFIRKYGGNKDDDDSSPS